MVEGGEGILRRERGRGGEKRAWESVEKGREFHVVDLS